MPYLNPNVTSYTPTNKLLMLCKTVTRTYKNNDRDHVGLAAGTAAAEEHLPRYFAKSGYAGEDPKTTKKQGSGKGNW